MQDADTVNLESTAIVRVFYTCIGCGAEWPTSLAARNCTCLAVEEVIV